MAAAALAAARASKGAELAVPSESTTNPERSKRLREGTRRQGAAQGVLMVAGAGDGGWGVPTAHVAPSKCPIGGGEEARAG